MCARGTHTSVEKICSRCAVKTSARMRSTAVRVSCRAASPVRRSRSAAARPSNRQDPIRSAARELGPRLGTLARQPRAKAPVKKVNCSRHTLLPHCADGRVFFRARHAVLRVGALEKRRGALEPFLEPTSMPVVTAMRTLRSTGSLIAGFRIDGSIDAVRGGWPARGSDRRRARRKS